MTSSTRLAFTPVPLHLDLTAEHVEPTARRIRVRLGPGSSPTAGARC